MELKKFKKNKTYKKTLLALGIAGMCLGGGILLNKSYALYETKKEYNVINGVVPDFGYDVKLAVIVDGKKQDEIPNSPIGQDGNYYNVQVDCTSSKTQGLWDYNAWRLNLDYIESNSKCTLTFTSSMSKTDYDKYIQAGVALRRNTYRGKDITKYYTGAEKVNGRDLYGQISNGTFDDIYVGDYFTGKSGNVWLIADLDNYLHTGDDNHDLDKHHATIISLNSLGNAPMSSKDTTEWGYAESLMVEDTLSKILTNTLTPDFGTHVLEYRNLLTIQIDPDIPNKFGQGQEDGVATSWKWVSRKLDLMSEVNVFGTTIVSSSSFYDVGIDNRQYAIFQLKPEFIVLNMNGKRYDYWLKAIATSKRFVYVALGGLPFPGLANTEPKEVRPRFLID